MATQEERMVTTTFKMYGFTLKSEAAQDLRMLLSPFSHAGKIAWIEKIVDRIPKLKLSSPILTKKDVAEVVSLIEKENELNNDNILSVISAFKIPRLKYSVDRKKFFAVKETEENAFKFIGTSEDKANLFVDRYSLLNQRTRRNELFSPSVLGTTSTNRRFALHTIEYLLGTSTKVDHVIVLGMLTQIKEGWYEDGLFHVTIMGMPPVETHEKTRKYFGSLDFLKGLTDTSPRCDVKLKELEMKDQSTLFVFLSDIWLDNPATFTKLEILLDGFSDCPPTCFVLCGNFLKPLNFGGSGESDSNITDLSAAKNLADVLKDNLEKFADLIEKFPLVMQQSYFVFVPGISDPGISGAFPRKSLPKYVTAKFAERIPNAVFATNPCRIRFYSQEIVVFREDVLSKMGRNAFYFPTTTNEDELYSHFVKTLLSQAHLAPLPLQTCPIYWPYDQSMRLYPLPDVVVVADRFKPFTNSQAGCIVTNPGSFSRNGHCFKAYYPATKRVEDSRVPDAE
ncbi:unnamed protein product [Notodromas monacha]|uniref:DNA polymerase epsilon subunit n=1 Tax=Notodromas monacha TaxID=399045 RepID=A0A7R9BBQ8_9CRUS|nr:unnamed protein product [Notodromas monacha]CAG0912372.1 unnamed protein product [Notodromas monacha]